jgi:hypothetical protein
MGGRLLDLPDRHSLIAALVAVWAAEAGAR